MKVYGLRLLIDVPDVEAFSDWFYDHHEGIVATHGGDTVVEIEVSRGETAVEAAKVAVGLLLGFPSLQVLGLDLDLVNASDVADRIGVSRQYVSQLVAGTAGPGGFPRPLGTPGRMRVWDWGSVNEWLRQIGKADDEVRLTYDEARVFDAWLHASGESVELPDLWAPGVAVTLLAHLKGPASVEGSGAISSYFTKGSMNLPVNLTSKGAWRVAHETAGSSIADEAAEYLAGRG